MRNGPKRTTEKKRRDRRRGRSRGIRCSFVCFLLSSLASQAFVVYVLRAECVPIANRREGCLTLFLAVRALVIFLSAVMVVITVVLCRERTESVISDLSYRTIRHRNSPPPSSSLSPASLFSSASNSLIRSASMTVLPAAPPAPLPPMPVFLDPLFGPG